MASVNSSFWRPVLELLVTHGARKYLGLILSSHGDEYEGMTPYSLVYIFWVCKELYPLVSACHVRDTDDGITTISES
jgi:hypothetical protein